MVKYENIEIKNSMDNKMNMLAVPRGKEYRDCFRAPDGFKFWACDYSS